MRHTLDFVSETSDFDHTEPLLMTARQVVEQWPNALTRAQLWRWAREGRIPVVRYPSGRMRFRRSDIEALLTPRVAPAAESSVESAPSVSGGGR